VKKLVLATSVSLVLSACGSFKMPDFFKLSGVNKAPEKTQSTPQTSVASVATEKSQSYSQSGLANQVPEIVAIADQIHTGKFPCELGQSVNIEQDRRSPTQFFLDFKGERYHLTPVKTSSGAIRLEDEAKGAVWIQLSNKSMLMNDKLGQRQADECKSPAQVAVSNAMKTNPGINILEPSSPVARK